MKDFQPLNHFTRVHIPDLPDDLLFGWATIQSGLSEAVLSEEEKSEFASISNQQRKNEYLSARHLCRYLTQQETNSVKWKVVKDPLGKPSLSSGDQNRYISFSHSKAEVFCVISDSLDVGIDAEFLNREIHPDILQRILSSQEWKVFGEEHPVKLWTMKEAAVKQLGTGLRTNLKEIEIEKEKGGFYTVSVNGQDSRQGFAFEFNGYAVAVVWHQK